MTSISPSASACDQNLAVVFGAQRRRHLEEGAVGADVVFVERDVIDRGRGGDAEAGVLGAAQHLKRLRAGDRGGVIAPAGQRDEAQVALEHDGFGGFGNAKQAEPRGEFAFVHHAVADQVGIFGVVHDQRVEIAGIGQRAAQHLRIGDALCAVGEGDGAGGLQQADLGHFFAGEALGQRRHRMHMHDRGVAGAAQHKVDGGRIVDRRRGVGLADDGGDAARGGRFAGRGERLAMAGARLADEGAHVDQARRNDLAVAIEDLGAFRDAGGADAALGVADLAIGDQDVAMWCRGRATDRLIRALASRIGRRSRQTFMRCGKIRVTALRAPPCARRRPSRPARG